MQSQVRDRGANYNAFGWDPNGRLAYLASFFYGPAYVPTITLQQFAGPAEPPRYGPPARYQLSCLPAGFQPRRPPNFLDPQDPDEIPQPPYLDPPNVFDPQIFAAFQHVARFRQFMPEEETGDIETDVDDVEEDEDLDQSEWGGDFEEAEEQGDNEDDNEDVVDEDKQDDEDKEDGEKKKTA
ncbi:hypothetical protein Hypma_014049 [Hypsizygus marmoreus]|uniref:Uncharacterized protein n=1 Tax=Hypsizygus marmoreus TaxID=39966 RepID=A0A369K7E3_HYPMA|nr:hypothetical protein Hypma_014049 [Hypsizygus marmoreus]